MLALGEANPAKAPAYHMTSLAAGLWAGEMAAVARAEARIEKQGHRFMLFGAGGFSYPYDDWGSHRRGRK